MSFSVENERSTVSKKQRRDIPRFTHPIIETHCHLDYLDDGDLKATLDRAGEVGVEKVITIAVSPDNLNKVVELVESDDRVWGTQGIHPHEAESYSPESASVLSENLEHPRILAVGEIGLDYFYDHADRAVQRRVFEQQLELAAVRELPVVIHTRDADEDTKAILENYVSSLSAGGVIHSFTSGIALAEYCISEGFCLGFNGITTFNSAENVRDVVRITPLENILLETDAPYLTPVPYRGRPNAPCYLPFIAETLAELKAIDIEELLRVAYQNSQRLFFSQAAV
ncbi:MAG: TatD DNase family protein [Halieaceae bacterium]|jgi:TatD DNase family protein